LAFERFHASVSFDAVALECIMLKTGCIPKYRVLYIFAIHIIHISNIMINKEDFMVRAANYWNSLSALDDKCPDFCAYELQCDQHR
jgi:hypothetical protein